MSIRKSLFACAMGTLLICGSALADLEIKPYGGAQYFYRGRIWNASVKDSSASTFDHYNLVKWQVGLKAKVDDQLSLQFQIGNDWVAGENVTWFANNTVSGRKKIDETSVSISNIFVHLAYARWNPGYMYMDLGVIPLVSNGTLDLLERSINSGSYDQAGYQTYFAQAVNSMMAFRLGAPILKDNIKLSAEVVTSVIDSRVQSLTSKGDRGGIDSKSPKDNPPSFLVMLNLPVTAGGIKVTPELTAVTNRNYNSAKEKGDHEIIGGLSASYKVNDMVSVSLNGGYGMIDNCKSKVGAYGNSDRSAAYDGGYESRGLLIGAGTAVKAGPGVFAFDAKYGNSINKKSKTDTDIDNIYIDPRYTWNVHPNVTIQPRWRVYIISYDKDRGGVETKMENRPELTIGASF